MRRSSSVKEVAGERGFDAVARQYLEAQLELFPQLILPLLDKAARRADQAALHIAAHDQSRIKSPAMIVLPAPGSSASKKRSGWRGSISP